MHANVYILSGTWSLSMENASRIPITITETVSIHIWIVAENVDANWALRLVKLRRVTSGLLISSGAELSPDMHR